MKEGYSMEHMILNYLKDNQGHHTVEEINFAFPAMSTQEIRNNLISIMQKKPRELGTFILDSQEIWAYNE